MSEKSLPLIAGCGVASDENRAIYDAWATKYETDVRQWGYDLPEKVAGVLKEHVRNLSMEIAAPIRVLDAGSGDGLSGMALRKSAPACYLAGCDISLAMLDIARKRNCYDGLLMGDLNKGPLPYPTDDFDVVSCTGTLTYVDPASGLLREFARIVRPGGIVCYTNRTDKLASWREVESEMERKGAWHREDRIGPLPYLPLNGEYGTEIEVVIFLYRVH